MFNLFFVFGLLFGLSYSSIKDDNNLLMHNDVYLSNNVPIKNVTSRYSMTYMGIGDLMSEDTCNSFLSWCADNTYYQGFINGDETFRYYNLLLNYPTPTANDNIDNLFYISNLNNNPNNDPTSFFQARRLRLYSSVTNASSYRMWFYYIGFGNDGNNEEYALVWYRFTDIVNSVPLRDGSPSTLFNARFTYKYDYNVTDGIDVNLTDYAMMFYPQSTGYDMFCRNIILDTDTSYWQGYTTGQQNGYNDGYQAGLNDFLDTAEYNPEMLTIFTGILNVALLPVNMFLTIFNFEVFGINIAGFVSSLLTISIIIIIVRFIFGGKSNG